MLKPNSTTTSNLIRARELIADKKNWCQDALFRGEAMCALGALYRAAGAREDGSGMMDMMDMTVHVASKYLADAAGHEFHLPCPAWVNDTHGHAEVMRMYDKAIELSLQEGIR
jgi:hypothetical protein